MISNNLVYHDLMLMCISFFFSVEAKEDLDQMRKGKEELIDKSNISKAEEELNESQC